MLKINCWGSRGSIPVSGPGYVRHGGATTCLEIRPVDGSGAEASPILIDCGSGLAEFARRKGKSCRSAVFLQTHMHWDHLQGFPFFSPIFNGEAQFRFLAARREGRSLQEALNAQMKRPYFPVALEELPAQLSFETIPAAGSREIAGVKITWAEMCHPSGSTAYRIDCAERSVVFSGDVEVQLGGRDELVELASGADLLIMDAQYLPDEYPARRGFGHSTPIDAVDIALAAGVKQLMMTHHDPNHDDRRLDEKLEMAKAYAGERGAAGLEVGNLRDGQELLLGEAPARGQKAALADGQAAERR
jgi:phosphoribosyl 1,2-cyclic phosphodiesterase